MFSLLRQTVRSMRDHLLAWRHASRLRRQLGRGDSAHQSYLRAQLDRTLLKRRAALPARAEPFLARVEGVVDLPSSDTLCVGCRNESELARLRELGARRVVGIDLFSESPDVLVMDMHALTFPAGTFDLIYSSHSLEHAIAPRRAASEFLRVLRPGGVIAIEVPVNFDPRGADLQDFGSAEGVLELFQVREVEVLHSETAPPRTPSNGLDFSVLRLVFRPRP